MKTTCQICDKEFDYKITNGTITAEVQFIVCPECQSIPDKYQKIQNKIKCTPPFPLSYSAEYIDKNR